MMGRVGAGLEYLVKGSGPLTIAAGYGGAFYRADGPQGRPATQAYLLLFCTDRMGTRLTPDSGFMPAAYHLIPKRRSEEPRGGVDWSSTSSCRGWPTNKKKKNENTHY